MTPQTLLEFDTRPTQPADRVGFEIGWDHGRHGLVPEPALMQAGSALGQGWLAARAVFGPRTLAAPRPVRLWLALRVQAWQQRAAFEALQITPQYLQQIETPHCPVTRASLGGGAGESAPVVVRLCAERGYCAGNLAVVSSAAAGAMEGRSAADVHTLAARLAREALPAHDGLDAAAWARLATLLSFAVVLPPAQAAGVALRALPPRRVRVLNPLQGLQVLLTMRLAAPGWSRQARLLADTLGDDALRHDFNLFVGAIAPRLMSIPAEATPQQARWGQEDAWADARLLRRWQHFATQLTPALTEALLARLAASALGGAAGLPAPPPGRRPGADGWSAATRTRVARSPRQSSAAAAGTARRPPQKSSAAMPPSA